VQRFAGPGTYTVSLTVADDAGCISTSATKDVIVNMKPVIEAGPSVVVAAGEKVTFKATASNTTNVQFRWSPASLLDDASTLTPSYIATHDQTFVLTATTVETTCTATDELTVEILRPVKVPNAFSPNGDGINDNWQITNLSDYEKASVQVYNRYGQTVYKSSGYSVPWDGKMNGNPLPVGTYYYIIEFKKGYAPLTGSVTILR
jgi:gliding motility-associated-like protein